MEKTKNVIDLHGFNEWTGEEIKENLQAVRALIVTLIGGVKPETSINLVDVSNALYTLQVLTDETNYKD